MSGLVKTRTEDEGSIDMVGVVEREKTEAQRRSKAYLDGFYDGVEEGKYQSSLIARLKRVARKWAQ